MKTIFDTIRPAKVYKTAFDLSHEKKLSMEMGKLIPVLCQEVVPGDTFKINTQSLIRFAPLVSPVMHKINAYIHYFYIPNRILWDDWKDFIVGKPVLTVPSQTLTNVTAGSIADYLGFPVGSWTDADEDVNTMAFRAYFAIWNEFYRDQNLQSEVDISTLEDDYPVIGAVEPLKRAWNKDYFTSALPSAQYGSPVQMSADVYYDQLGTKYRATGGSSPTGAASFSTITGGSGLRGASVPAENTIAENIEEILIDVNELRRATRLQRFLERNLQAGSRYIEHLLAHWGVRSSDARLHRPEYIGGGKSPVLISEVLNNTGSDDANAHPVGSMAGHGINVGSTNQAFKYCEEHGYIMGIMSVMPDTAYFQGLPKQFSRLTYLDYYFPEFATLGEQAVPLKELYLMTDPEKNATTFGYQARYAEYKYAPSSVHGEFRDSLEHWHYSRKFGSQPALNEAFIQYDGDNRIFAVPSEKEHLYVQLYHNIVAKRPMPYYHDPSL